MAIIGHIQDEIEKDYYVGNEFCLTDAHIARVISFVCRNFELMYPGTVERFLCAMFCSVFKASSTLTSFFCLRTFGF